jgi:hypothetical protein
MAKTDGKTGSVETIKGWFGGRLPEGWFSSLDVKLEGDQIVVIGTLADQGGPAGAGAEEKAGFASGRISRFREQTRGNRIAIAREAEAEFEKFVTWGASLGDTSRTFNPGGSGRRKGGEEARKVMIGRRGPAPAPDDTQTF